MAKKQRNRNISHIDAMPTFIHLKGKHANSTMRLAHNTETCGYTEKDDEGTITFRCSSQRPVGSISINGKIHRRCINHIEDMPKPDMSKRILAQLIAIVVEDGPRKEDMTKWAYHHKITTPQMPTPPIVKIKRNADGTIAW